MAKTGLVIFGVLIGVPMTVLHVWSIWGMLFGKATAPSSPEFANTPYDEGGGFAGGWTLAGPAEQSAVVSKQVLDLKTAA